MNAMTAARRQVTTLIHRAEAVAREEAMAARRFFGVKHSVEDISSLSPRHLIALARRLEAALRAHGEQPEPIRLFFAESRGVFGWHLDRIYHATAQSAVNQFASPQCGYTPSAVYEIDVSGDILVGTGTGLGVYSPA